MIKRYSYDSFGRLIGEQIESAGKTLSQTAKAYSAFHLLSETDAEGNVTLYDYDAAGRVRQVTVGERRTVFEYDSIGRNYKTYIYYEDQKYNTKVYMFDILNRVLEERMEDSLGNPLTKSAWQYDDINQTVSSYVFVDGGESVETKHLNSRGEVFLKIDSEGNEIRTFTTFNYMNEKGQFVPYNEMIDPCGQATVCIGDALGRIVQTSKKDFTGNTIQKQNICYDLSGNLCKQTDHVIVETKLEKSIVNQKSYDAMNRMVAIIENVGPTQKQTSFHYNKYGQQDLIVKANGIKLNFQYDGLGRLEEYFDSEKSFHYAYEYNLNSKPIVVTNKIDEIQTIKSYDCYGSVIKETLGNGLSVQYCYDLIGRPTKITYPDKSESRYSYSNVFLKKISRFDQSGNELYVHHYKTYDLANHIISVDLIKNNGSIDYTFDSLGRRLGITSAAWSSHVEAYDKVGNILQKNTSDCIGQQYSNYSYDSLYQLEKEESDSSHEYTYDSINNRLSKDSVKYMINDLNQIISDGEHQYVYDLNGNLVQMTGNDGKTEYRYDGLDRLIAVITDTQKFQYQYDEENRRLSKQRFDLDLGGHWSLCDTVLYLYQGQNETGSYDLDGNALELRVLGIGQGAEIGAAIAVEIANKIYTPIHDLHSNTVCLLDADNNQIAESYRLDAFGIMKTFDKYGEEITPVNPWRFSCKRVDEETGFVYFGRRYYLPSLGRWITTDPLGLAAGPNLYAYVNNSPLNHIDLYGLYALPNFMEKEKPTLASIEFARSEGANSRSTMFDINFHKKDINYRGDNAPSLIVKAYHHIRHNMAGFLCARFSAWDPDDIGLKSEVYEIGKWYDPDTKIALFTGIQNTLNDGIKSAQMLSNLIGGYQVDLVSNLTTGNIPLDIVRCGLSTILGCETEAVKRGRSYIRSFFARSSAEARLLLVLHSEGAINGKNTMKYGLSKEIQQRVYILAIAPGAYIDEEYCKRALHYTSSHDFVPHLDSKGKERNKNNLKILERHKDAPFWDHSFDSPTFKDVLEDHLKNFLNKKGEYE